MDSEDEKLYRWEGQAEDYSHIQEDDEYSEEPEYDSAEDFEGMPRQEGSKRKHLAAMVTGNRSSKIGRYNGDNKARGDKMRGMKQSERTKQKKSRSMSNTIALMAEEPDDSIVAHKCKTCKVQMASLTQCRDDNGHTEASWKSHEYETPPAGTGNSIAKYKECVHNCYACETDAKVRENGADYTCTIMNTPLLPCRRHRFHSCIFTYRLAL